MTLRIAKYTAAMQRTTGMTNERGNMVFRDFSPTDRYVIDFADDFYSEGWVQFDTDQDAHYFGVWVNPTKLLTLTYAEGDWTLTRCRTAAHYNREIQSMLDFYGEGRIALVIGEHASHEVRQDRSSFLIDETTSA